MHCISDVMQSPVEALRLSINTKGFDRLSLTFIILTESKSGIKAQNFQMFRFHKTKQHALFYFADFQCFEYYFVLN